MWTYFIEYTINISVISVDAKITIILSSLWSCESHQTICIGIGIFNCIGITIPPAYTCIGITIPPAYTIIKVRLVQMIA